MSELVVPAITIWQPWASLIAIGPEVKPHETRSWPAPKHLIGKPIAIHAASKWNRELADLCRMEPYRSVLAAAGYTHWRQPHSARVMKLDGLPLGAVVGVGILEGCSRTEDVAGLTELQRGFGDYSPGRFAWKITRFQEFSPAVPATGAQGIWRWTAPEHLRPWCGGKP